jgi:hypothetical protein
MKRFSVVSAIFMVVSAISAALGRAAMKLGDEKINIDYSYCGLEPGSTLAMVVFGVDKLTKAAPLLDKLAAENG